MSRLLSTTIVLLCFFITCSSSSSSLSPLHITDEGDIQLTLPSSISASSSTLSINKENIGLRHKGDWLRPLAGLTLSSTTTHPIHGQDNLGSYEKIQIVWQTEDGLLRYETNVLLYDQQGGGGGKETFSSRVIAFQQVFPDGTTGSSTGDQDQVISAFPVFSSKDGYLADKGFLTYAHNMACPNGVLFCTQVGTFQESIEMLSTSHGQAGGVPLVIFDDDNVTPPLILSPMNRFMSTNLHYDNQTLFLSYGVQGRVDNVPPGYSLSTILYIGKPREGINRAMEGWGQALRTYHQTHHALDDDVTINYLSYYTDNGAYYYYTTEVEEKDTGKKTYEETLIDVWDYSKRQGIPYRALQIDSWWYYKGRDNGVKRWEGRPDIFPSGLEALHQRLDNVPIIAHNRWWSVETDYARQNGGKYDFIIEPREPLPSASPSASAPSAAIANQQHLLSFEQDEEEDMEVMKEARRQYRRHQHRRLFGDDYAPLPYGAGIPLEKRFWVDLFATSKAWGLYTYEQDWLHNEFLTLNHTLATVDGARDWLLQMGQAAEEVGVHIQYCMAFPRFYLQTLEVPAVTQIRVSDDYGPSTRPDQWALGDTAMLAHALGLSPFKDVFWSTYQEPGNVYGNETREAKPNLEAAISSLSMGPVSPGDRIGSEDKELILRSCTSTGLLLKPSRPISSVDATFASRAFTTAADRRKRERERRLVDGDLVPQREGQQIDGRGLDGKGEGEEGEGKGKKSKGPDGLVLSTYSLIGSLRFEIILGAALNTTYQITRRDFAPRPPGEEEEIGRHEEEDGSSGISTITTSSGITVPPRIAYSHSFNRKQEDLTLQVFSPPVHPLSLLPCGREDFRLWYISPILPNGLVLLGELTKWVPISPQRIQSIDSMQESGLTVIHLKGGPGEVVEMTLASTTSLLPPHASSSSVEGGGKEKGGSEEEGEREEGKGGGGEEGLLVKRIECTMNAAGEGWLKVVVANGGQIVSMHCEG